VKLILNRLVFVWLLTAGFAGAAERPNIIVILADDLGYGDVSCYNAQSKVPTPRIDRLAREGMRFTDAHSPSTVCTPTRYSLLTGQMPFRAGRVPVFTGAGGPCLIRENQFTLPQMLRNRGYTTAMTGKWHVGLTFLDAQGKRIAEQNLDGVKRIDYSRAIPSRVRPVLRHGLLPRYGPSVCVHRWRPHSGSAHQAARQNQAAQAPVRARQPARPDRAGLRHRGSGHGVPEKEQGVPGDPRET
jgi:arylsulfatase A-like enzyme